MSESLKKSAALEGATRRARNELSDLDKALKIVVDRMKEKLPEDASNEAPHQKRAVKRLKAIDYIIILAFIGMAVAGFYGF